MIWILWPIPDSDSATVAGEVYSMMLTESKLDIRQVASALHFAVQEVRKKTQRIVKSKIQNNFMAWVMYIHVGA